MDLRRKIRNLFNIPKKTQYRKKNKKSIKNTNNEQNFNKRKNGDYD